MSNFFVLGVLFFGVLLSINKIDASVEQANILKSLQTAQNSPWDPREEENSSNTEQTANPQEAELR